VTLELREGLPWCRAFRAGNAVGLAVQGKVNVGIYTLTRRSLGGRTMGSVKVPATVRLLTAVVARGVVCGRVVHVVI
jgi:hypothetical protein